MRDKARRLEDEVHDPYKSKGERQIARVLDVCGIEYRYEHPLAVVDRGKVRIWYVDFLLPEYGIILECIGMRGINSYDRQLEHKKGVYAELGLPVLFLGPEAFAGYWPRRVMEGIEGILEERAQVFRSKMAEGPLLKTAAAVS